MESLPTEINQEKQKRKRGRPKKYPGDVTIMIGYHGSKKIKEDLTQCAKKLGITSSELLRSIVEDNLKELKKLLEVSK